MAEKTLVKMVVRVVAVYSDKSEEALADAPLTVREYKGKDGKDKVSLATTGVEFSVRTPAGVKHASTGWRGLSFGWADAADAGKAKPAAQRYF